MIEVIDRIPTYPGRVKMTPVAGQENTYDMVRADAPTEVGTPINKALFSSISSDLTTLNQNVANIISAHASIDALGSIVAGSEFGLYENGILVPFIKVSNDYNGIGRCVIMRKHLYKREILTGSNNVYANSATDVWLNTEYLNLLDSKVQGAIEEVGVPCAAGNNNNVVTDINRKVFIASLAEYGITNQSYAQEGTQFPVFKTAASRVALFNGSPMYHWTRTPHGTQIYQSAYIRGDGSYGSDSTLSFAAGIRPVFTLPYDFEITVNTPSVANTVATAEVI